MRVVMNGIHDIARTCLRAMSHHRFVILPVFSVSFFVLTSIQIHIFCFALRHKMFDFRLPLCCLLRHTLRSFPRESFHPLNAVLIVIQQQSLTRTCFCSSLILRLTRCRIHFCKQPVPDRSHSSTLLRIRIAATEKPQNIYATHLRNHGAIHSCRGVYQRRPLPLVQRPRPSHLRQNRRP